MMWPLIMAGRIIARLRPPDKQYRVYYFFSFYHIGGAEKVHAQIAAATGGADTIIYFTRRSANDGLRKLFESTGCRIVDISGFTDNKFLYPLNIIMRGFISGHINRQPTTIAFNGQNNFGYKISPWVKKSVPQVELIHSLNTFSLIRIPFLPFITRTVMISEQRIADHLALYRQKSIPSLFDNKIVYISNAVQLPEVVESKATGHPVVLYAGRGGHEKRLHLVAEIARRITGIDSRITFEVMGDVSEVLDQSRFPFIRFYGNVSDPAEVDAIYQRSSILILTSETEGFPMVVIEAMARGNVILSTSVGDLPKHIINGVNGFLFSDTTNEELIISEAVGHITALASDPALMATMSAANTAYAYQHFSLTAFNQSYQQLFNQLKDRH